MKNIRAKKFADALDQWDAYKAEMTQKLASDVITEVEYQQKMQAKAEELDL